MADTTVNGYVRTIINAWSEDDGQEKDGAINSLYLLFGDVLAEYLDYRHIYTSYDAIRRDEQRLAKAKSDDDQAEIDRLWSQIEFVNHYPDTSLWKATDDGRLYPMDNREDMVKIIRDLKMIRYFREDNK